MIRVHLTGQHLPARIHMNDGELIKGWLLMHQIPVELLAVPSVIEIHKDAIIVNQYYRDPVSGELRVEGDRAMVVPTRYECTPLPLPSLTDNTKVEHDAQHGAAKA